MTVYWKDYDSFPRIALVYNQKLGETSLHLDKKCEVLLIQNSHVSFSSDGYELKGEGSKFYSFKTGDIITIRDGGLVHQLYSADEGCATIFITGRCNSNCIMCPASDGERQHDGGMEAEWIREYISLLPFNLDHITVTGGEPTLRTEIFFEVMKQIADNFSEVETLLLSNGRSFATTKIVDRLVTHCPQYLRIGIPIHGSYASLHDSITQVSGSFSQTSMGIHNLLGKNISVEIRVVVSKLNCLDLLSIAEYIVGQFPSVQLVNFIGLESRGSCAKNYEKVFCDYRESAQLIVPAINKLAQNGIDSAIYNYPLCFVDRGYWGLYRQSISPDKVRFAKGCNVCEAKSMCGGFFSTTLSMTKPKVAPIHF